MKICLISNLFPPYSRGGAERVAELIANGLPREGHEVFVISAKPIGTNSQFLNPNFQANSKFQIPNFNTDYPIYRFFPLNIFFYGNLGKRSALTRLVWHILDTLNLHSYFVVKKILKKEKPNLILTHNLKGLGLAVPRAILTYQKKFAGEETRWVHTIHDLQLITPSGLIIKGKEKSIEHRNPLTKIYRLICRFLFNSPDAVVSPSKWLLDFYVQTGFFKTSKKAVLPNPIMLPSPSLFQETSFTPRPFPAVPSPTRNPQKDSSMFQKSDRIRILFFGQIEEHKGVLFLIETFKKFVQNYSSSLLVIGSGSKLNKVQKLAESYQEIMVRGFAPHKQLEEVFRDIDITIVPSLCYENSPLAIYESLACGVPVLAAKVGGVAELICDGENGITFEAGNQDDLLKKLKWCVHHRNKLFKMRSAAQESVKKFNLDSYIKELLKQ